MKLSEAIRLGAMLRPQTFGPFLSSKGCATCAMGAALDAVGRLSEIRGPRNTTVNEERVIKIWPWLDWRFPRAACLCPQCNRLKKFKSIYDLIVHLNDVHHFSRQRIADLIEFREKEAAGQKLEQKELRQLEANLNAVKKRNVQKHNLKQHSGDGKERPTAEAGCSCGLVYR